MSDKEQRGWTAYQSAHEQVMESERIAAKWKEWLKVRPSSVQKNLLGHEFGVGPREFTEETVNSFEAESDQSKIQRILDWINGATGLPESLLLYTPAGHQVLKTGISRFDQHLNSLPHISENMQLTPQETLITGIRLGVFPRDTPDYLLWHHKSLTADTFLRVPEDDLYTRLVYNVLPIAGKNNLYWHEYLFDRPWSRDLGVVITKGKPFTPTTDNSILGKLRTRRSYPHLDGLNEPK